MVGWFVCEILVSVYVDFEFEMMLVIVFCVWLLGYFDFNGNCLYKSLRCWVK